VKKTARQKPRTKTARPRAFGPKPLIIGLLEITAENDLRVSATITHHVGEAVAETLRAALTPERIAGLAEAFARGQKAGQAAGQAVAGP